MTSSITASPTNVISFASTRVPIACVGESVGEVRDRLVGGELLESASQIAVLHDGQLRGLVRIEELLSAARDVPLVSVMDLDPPNIDPAFGSGPLATLVQDLLSIAIDFGVTTLVFF